MAVHECVYMHRRARAGATHPYIVQAISSPRTFASITIRMQIMPCLSSSHQSVLLLQVFAICKRVTFARFFCARGFVFEFSDLFDTVEGVALTSLDGCEKVLHLFLFVPSDGGVFDSGPSCLTGLHFRFLGSQLSGCLNAQRTLRQRAPYRHGTVARNAGLRLVAAADLLAFLSGTESCATTAVALATA